VSWYDADAACDAQGFHLVQFDNRREDRGMQRGLAQAFRNRTWWSDGTDAASEGTFVWSTSGLPFTYTGWYPGQPDDVAGDEDCVGFWPAGPGWADLRCDEEMGFICEREL
jgi:hypothetical protein